MCLFKKKQCNNCKYWNPEYAPHRFFVSGEPVLGFCEGVAIHTKVLVQKPIISGLRLPQGERLYTPRDYKCTLWKRR